MQATWFCIQCITRLTGSLSISLLELNTFAHALCTLLIYLLWWNKPLDVEEPTTINGDNADLIPALLIMLDCTQRKPNDYSQGLLGKRKGFGHISVVPVEDSNMDKTVDETLEKIASCRIPSANQNLGHNDFKCQKR